MEKQKEISSNPLLGAVNPTKVYILRPKTELPENDNPWEPWYDKTFGFIVRAIDEATARKYADESAGDENRGEFMNKEIAKTKNPWLDEKYTTCEELSGNGDEGVIMKDFASA